MSGMSEREVRRRLVAARDVPPPPDDLLARLREAIPPAVPAGHIAPMAPQVLPRRAERGARFPSGRPLRWLAAAAMVVVACGLLLLRSPGRFGRMPLPEASSAERDSRAAVAEPAQALSPPPGRLNDQPKDQLDRAGDRQQEPPAPDALQRRAARASAAPAPEAPARPATVPSGSFGGEAEAAPPPLGARQREEGFAPQPPDEAAAAARGDTATNEVNRLASPAAAPPSVSAAEGRLAKPAPPRPPEPSAGSVAPARQPAAPPPARANAHAGAEKRAFSTDEPAAPVVAGKAAESLNAGSGEDLSRRAAAAYSLVRESLQPGHLAAARTLRVEDLVAAFDYGDPSPRGAVAATEKAGMASPAQRSALAAGGPVVAQLSPPAAGSPVAAQPSPQAERDAAEPAAPPVPPDSRAAEGARSKAFAAAPAEPARPGVPAPAPATSLPSPQLEKKQRQASGLLLSAEVARPPDPHPSPARLLRLHAAVAPGLAPADAWLRLDPRVVLRYRPAGAERWSGPEAPVHCELAVGPGRGPSCTLLLEIELPARPDQWRGAAAGSDMAVASLAAATRDGLEAAGPVVVAVGLDAPGWERAPAGLRLAWVVAKMGERLRSSGAAPGQPSLGELLRQARSLVPELPGSSAPEVVRLLTRARDLQLER